MIAADRQHRGVPDRPLVEDRQVGRAAADVDERDAELLLVRRQHRLGRGELLEHRLRTSIPARLTQVTRFCIAVVADGDDVDVGLES